MIGTPHGICMFITCTPLEDVARKLRHVLWHGHERWKRKIFVSCSVKCKPFGVSDSHTHASPMLLKYHFGLHIWFESYYWSTTYDSVMSSKLWANQIHFHSHQKYGWPSTFQAVQLFTHRLAQLADPTSQRADASGAAPRKLRGLRQMVASEEPKAWVVAVGEWNWRCWEIHKAIVKAIFQRVWFHKRPQPFVFTLAKWVKILLNMFWDVQTGDIGEGVFVCFGWVLFAASWIEQESVLEILANNSGRCMIQFILMWLQVLYQIFAFVASLDSEWFSILGVIVWWYMTR